MNNRDRVLIACFLLSTFNAAHSANPGKAQCDPPSRVSGTLTGSPSITGKEAYDRAFAAAEKLRMSAAKNGAEWLKTGELLQRSTQAASEDNWKKALQLVREAHFQAETALQQAEREERAWKHRVVGYSDQEQ